MAANLAYTGGGIGVWFGGAGSDNGFGRYYLQAEKDSIAALLTDGWHVPTYAEWSALSVAAGGTVGGTSFSLAGALPNWKYATGTNTTGFSALASGYRSFGTWNGYAFNPSGFADDPELRFWLSDMLGADTRFGHVLEIPYAPYKKSLGYGTLNTSGEKALSIRLVRDAPQISFYVPHSGAWTKTDELHQGGGSWRRDTSLYVPHGGAWTEVAE